MTKMAFDTLKYALRLREVGVSEEQAEVQAQTMAEAFGFYIDNLVTKDHLDVSFAEVDAQFAKVDIRFAELDTRLVELESRVDEKLALIRIKQGQHSLIHAATFTAVVIPLIRDFLV